MIPARMGSKRIKRKNLRLINGKPLIEYVLDTVSKISIFDAGCGYHRQISGGKRVMLHLNFTENLAYTGWKKNWNPPDHDYWFSEKNNNLHDKLFTLVNRKFKASLLTPSIYSKN